WGELGAALPAAGGSYHFLLESYGRSKWGRLMAFLFVWQILISGPLEVGSGLVAAAQFSTALSPEFKAFDEEHTRKFEVKISDEPEPDGRTLGVAVGPSRLFGLGLGVLILVLLYRRGAPPGPLRVGVLFCVVCVRRLVVGGGGRAFWPGLALARALP